MRRLERSFYLLLLYNMASGINPVSVFLLLITLGCVHLERYLQCNYEIRNALIVPTNL